LLILGPHEREAARQSDYGLHLERRRDPLSARGHPHELGRAELDEGRGVAGIDIANKLRIHPAFVTNQTKTLEKAGFLSRRPAADDARFVLMALTEKATTEIEKLSKRRLALNSTMFNELDEKTLADLNAALATIAKNARLAARLLAIDVS
jgi:DNA-binding MarR family transcriptional regulator